MAERQKKQYTSRTHKNGDEELVTAEEIVAAAHSGPSTISELLGTDKHTQYSPGQIKLEPWEQEIQSMLAGRSKNTGSTRERDEELEAAILSKKPRKPSRRRPKLLPTRG